MMKIDIHAHVLPGIDDGAKDWDACLKMLTQSAACGVNHVFATPHSVPWQKGASQETIQRLCKQAEAKYKETQGTEINIYPGNEVYYNVEVLDKLKRGEILTLGGTRYVLVEFKPSAPYQELFRAAREFGDAGYIPIYAHVERYQCLSDMDKVKKLKRMGVRFQMNVESYQGSLFDKMARRARMYLKSGVIDFLATDMHSARWSCMMTSENLQWLQKHLTPKYRQKLLCDNAMKILIEAKG